VPLDSVSVMEAGAAQRRRVRAARDRGAGRRRLARARSSRGGRVVLRSRRRARSRSARRTFRTPSTPKQAAQEHWSAWHRCNSRASSERSANACPSAYCHHPAMRPRISPTRRDRGMQRDGRPRAAGATPGH